MLKFVRLTVDEIVFDPAHAGDTVTKSCLRPPRFTVTGLCDCGGSIAIALEDASSPCPGHYHFAVFPDLTADGVSSEIRIRYEAGMTFLGSFRRDDEIWGLFFRPEKRP